MTIESQWMKSKKYSRTVTFFGSYWMTISFILSIFPCATFDRSDMPWSCAVSSLNMSSARSTREASCLSALLKVQFVTACSSSSVTFGLPSASCKLVRDKYFGSTTRCTKGISVVVPQTHSPISRKLNVIPTSIQHTNTKNVR